MINYKDELDEFVSGLTKSLEKDIRKTAEENLIASIIDIYENDYSYSEYTSNVLSYNRNVAEYNYKQYLFQKDGKPSFDYMVEIPVISKDIFDLIRELKKGE